MKTRRVKWWTLGPLVPWLVHAAPGPVVTNGIVINEFMASNIASTNDEDGATSDWMELFNSGVDPVNLAGWFLTDTAANLTKWCVPAVTIQPNRYLLVWASGKDRADPVGELHTNFKLLKEGEFLALVDPATNVVSAFGSQFPAQQADVSYGRDRADLSVLGYFPTPTPGAPNSLGGPGFAEAPGFSLESGAYTNESLTLTLAAPAGTTIRYTLDGSVPTTTSLLYAGPIPFATNLTIKARVFQAGLLPSPVVARTFVFLDASTRGFNSNLPLVLLSTSGRGIFEYAPGQTRTKGALMVFDAGHRRTSLQEPPQFQGLAELEAYGQTSFGFPKKPYIIEIQDELGHDRNASLLGLPADADWKLDNPYNDKSFLNEFLSCELHERMGHYAVRRRFVEVFVDTNGGKLRYPQDYVGIMVLFEKIEQDRNRVNIAKLTPAQASEPEITGGYMFKKDKDSPGDLNFSTPGGNGFQSQLLKIHEPKPREITTNQLNWLHAHLTQFEGSLYAPDWLSLTGANHYSHYIDLDSFVDQHWIVEFAKSIDGYRLSTFFTKDRNGPIKMEPIWGWDRSFGNADYLEGGRTNGWYYADELLSEVYHIWLRRLITGTPRGDTTQGDPDFNQKITDRWSVLRINILNATNVLARIDELAALLNEAAQRDFAKYPTPGPTGTRLGTYFWPNPNGPPLSHVDYVHPTNYAGIIGEMKKWVLGRYLWIDSQFTPAPTFSPPDGMVTPNTPVTLSAVPGASIYFTLDGTDPRLPGGEISPRAALYTSPFTVTATVRLVARARKAGSWQNTWSAPAALTLEQASKPVITLQPLSLTALVGGSATFSVAATGSVPITFRWRRDGADFTGGIVLDAPTHSVLTVTNLTADFNGAMFSVAVTNLAGPGPLSSNAVLTVLLDSDHDGIPDLLEPLDGAADSDGDGVSNAAEYFAGTDGRDPQSYLKVDMADTGVATLRFTAVSNRTYSVQYTDGLNPTRWKRLANVLAQPATRGETLFDASSGTNRFYRLVTPVQP